MSDGQSADERAALALVVAPVTRAVSCTWCGTVASDGPPLDWTVQTSERGRGTEYMCTTCARTNLRSIEGRLDSDWW